ncbi:MAG: YggS family pyridoxal phosphate-dependent enzyme [Planctomycetota bacterium]
MEHLARNLEAIRADISAALRRCGDARREVTLVAVTKGASASSVDALAALGVLDIGESRVQEAQQKAAGVTAAVRWHLVGHLQGNKARKAAALFASIHSVDSVALVEALASTGRPLEMFLQVNVSGEASKHGVPPEGLRDLYRAAAAAPGLEVKGLMTIAPYADDPEAARPVFRALRELRDEMARRGEGPPVASLSMGMSGDYVVAVEEGATHLRVGTALLGPPRRSQG